MASSQRTIRQSISLPLHLASKVRAIARSRNLSANQVLVRLIEDGMASRENEKQRFFSVAQRLIESRNEQEQEALKEELARMTFGA